MCYCRLNTAILAFVMTVVLSSTCGATGAFHELDPQQRHTDVSGKLEITVSEPFTISSRDERPEMGRHEQPHLFMMPNGDIHLVFHRDRDIDAAERVILRSSDGGQSWEPMPIAVHRHEAVGVLSDGTVLVYDDYCFHKEGNVFVGEMCVSEDGGRTFGPVELATFIRPDNFATRAMAEEHVANYRDTSAQWSNLIGHALWRSVIELPDGTLIACAHTQYQGDDRLRTIVYRSTDAGRTWGSEVTVAYDPEIRGQGFCEPVMALLANGDLLCVMRTGGNRPLMQSRSTDGGVTWEPPVATGSLGVDPDLHLMSNGVLACSHGRPGNRIMFSADGTGEEWTDRLQIYEYERGSFGYTGIVEVEPETLLMVYDRRDTRSIEGVFIIVRRTD